MPTPSSGPRASWPASGPTSTSSGPKSSRSRSHDSPRGSPPRSAAAIPTVHVLDRLASDEPGHPVDQLDAVDLQFVEPRPFEDPVAAAGSGVAVQVHPGLFDRRLVGVDR